MTRFTTFIHAFCFFTTDAAFFTKPLLRVVLFLLIRKRGVVFYLLKIEIEKSGGYVGFDSSSASFCR